MKRILLIVLISIYFVSCVNDDDTIALCEIPSEISTTNITNNSATLNWTNINEVKEVTIEYGVSGFQIGTGTLVTASGSSITINNLLAETTYQYYILANCSIDNVSMLSDVNEFTTDANPVVAQFLPLLSQLNLFSGDLDNLTISSKTFKYDLNTRLFTDYAHKLRIIALPDGVALEYTGDGFPVFPNGTLIAKTFYYNLDETDLSVGKKILETRVLIRENDAWIIGNYKWNDAQTDANFTEEGSVVKVNWVNPNGGNMTADYQIPAKNDCTKCHSNAGNITPIGPKLRTMNFEIDGVNQLQKFIDAGQLTNAPSPSTIGALPNWENTSLTLEKRSRAYFDINCAHCHSPGGFCDQQSTLDLRFETAFDDTNIFIRRFSISARISTYNPGTSMPFIGTTMVHTEGVDLLQAFLDTL
jgi:uncharacterized repeat protein (TIGR03806 family)